MRKCENCPFAHKCRVPHDLNRFSRVCLRLEQQGREDLLQQRLRYYLETGDCLVDRGHVDLL